MWGTLGRTLEIFRINFRINDGRNLAIIYYYKAEKYFGRKSWKKFNRSIAKIPGKLKESFP